MSDELIRANEPIPEGEGAVEVYDRDHTGLSDMVRLKPTALVLIQPTTHDSKGAKLGQILDLRTEEAYDRITVVPMRVIRQRAMFPPGSTPAPGVKPLCRSNDGKTPSPFAQSPQSRSCKSCRFSQWGAGRQKPPCAEKWKMLVIVRDTKVPRTFTVGGLSIKAARMALERIEEDIFMAEQRGERRFMWQYSFTITSERPANKAYYIARFEELRRITDPAEFGPLYEKFVLTPLDEDEEEEEAQTADTLPGDVGEQIDRQEA